MTQSEIVLCITEISRFSDHVKIVYFVLHVRNVYQVSSFIAWMEFDNCDFCFI